jgi:release factor glutamine methyltransferase
MTTKAEPLAAALADARSTTVATGLARATAHLKECTDVPQLEAQILLAHLLDCSRADLFAHPERRLSLEQLSHYEALVKRRALGEPLPYLTGRVEFYGLDFSVDKRVLIPRPETEILVELALAHLSRLSQGRTADRTPSSGKRPVLLDIGTGSGCIAVTLALHAPDARVYAIDISAEALMLARDNAKRHGVSKRINFLQSDLFDAPLGQMDIVVANPPYIAREEFPGLPRQVREYEPLLALDGGSRGLEVIQRLLLQAQNRLRPAGLLLIEIGSDQGAAVTQLARSIFPQADITIHKDLARRDRVLSIMTRGISNSDAG